MTAIPNSAKWCGWWITWAQVGRNPQDKRVLFNTLSLKEWLALKLGTRTGLEHHITIIDLHFSQMTKLITVFHHNK